MLKELQIQIDDVYACPGKCPGCVLSTDERKVIKPDMPENILQNSISRLIEYVNSIEQLDRINLTYAIADHMTMTDEYLEKIYKLGKEVVIAANPKDKKHSAVFFTTALIGKEEKLLNRLKGIANFVEEVPFIPVAVLDPALLHSNKFGPKYENLILTTKELFGKVDLSINLSNPAISNMTPEELHDFGANNGFDEITINWTPTSGNIQYTMKDLPKLLEWLISFDKYMIKSNKIDSSFRPVIMKTIDSIMCFNESKKLQKTISSFTSKTVQKSIEIDHKGNLFPKLEAIGDVPQSPRFGYKELGNVMKDSIKEILDKNMKKVMLNMSKSYLKNNSCKTCDVSYICAGTGFHVFNDVLAKTDYMNQIDDCPHIAKSLIKYFIETGSESRV